MSVLGSLRFCAATRFDLTGLGPGLTFRSCDRRVIRCSFMGV
jgi:hypothetical protein